MPRRFTGWLLVGAHLATMSSASDIDSARMRRTLDLRADFHIAGVVTDQAGAPLSGAVLTITVHRFSAELLADEENQRSVSLEKGRFDIQEKDATAIELRASRQGYTEAAWQTHYVELLEARQRELAAQVASGALDRDTLEADRPRLFADLTSAQTNVVLVLTALNGPPATPLATFPRMIVRTNAPIDACAIFPKPAKPGAAVRIDLRLEWILPDPSGGAVPGTLRLHAIKGGGIQPMAETPLFGDQVYAPDSGYQDWIDLPIPRRAASTAFFLKSSEGDYAKIHAMIRRLRGGGEIVVDVFEGVVQTSGSRVLSPPAGKPE